MNISLPPSSAVASRTATSDGSHSFLCLMLPAAWRVAPVAGEERGPVLGGREWSANLL